MKVKLAARVITIGWSTANALSGAVFSISLSVEVIRLCSKDLWGSMVEVLLWFGLASHILSWGNQNLLLKEFSLTPKNMVLNWGKSLQARTWLYIVGALVLCFLPIALRLKLPLFVFLSANFLYRSYDVIILFKRQFIVSVLLETAGFLLTALYVFLFRSTMTINRLVAVFAVAELGKAIAVLFIFHHEFKLPPLKFRYMYFIIALPFFLLEFSGLLQSKTDLICVTYFFSKTRIAQYQVYVNFLLLVQSASGIILSPFVKNIYRLKEASVRKLSLRFFGLGAVLSIVAVLFVNFFILFFYHFAISSIALLGGVLFAVPIFAYLPFIFQLIKNKRQNTVVLINALGIISSALLNIILIPMSPDGISGAIYAIAITQWIMLFIYLVIVKQRTFEPAIA